MVPGSRVSEASPIFADLIFVLLVCEPERASQAGNRYTVTYTIKRRVLKVTTFNVNHFIYPYLAIKGV